MIVRVWFKKLFKLNKTVYQCFNPILKISAVGGMCNVIENENSYIVSPCLGGFQILTILLNMIHLVLLLKGYVYSDKNEDILNGRNGTKYVPERFDFITDMASPVIISLTTLMLRILNIMQLHKKLPKIFRKIEIAKQAVDFKNINSKDYVYAQFLVTLILFLCIPYQVASLFDGISLKSNDTLKFIVLTFNHYNNFSAVCLDIQFSQICYILKNRFQIVNEHLRNKHLEAFINTKKHISVWNYALEKQLKSILDLRDCHHKLCECCGHLNNLYNIQLLITLTNCVINALLNIYFAIYGVFFTSMQEGNELAVNNVMKKTIWVIFYFIRFADICAIAETLSKEANQTKILICDLLANCTDDNIKDVLWIFHAYSVSRKIEFSAFGFFNINLSLISSAISTGTTYLVILAQFHGKKILSKYKNIEA